MVKTRKCPHCGKEMVERKKQGAWLNEEMELVCPDNCELEKRLAEMRRKE